MKRAMIITALAVTLWPIQYLAWVPVVWCWRVTKILGVGVLLILVPIVGWVMIALRVARAFRADGPDARAYLRPWFIDQVRAA